MMPSQRQSPECCVFQVGVLQDNSDKILHHGDLEVTPSDLIYTSEELNTQVTWPLKYLRRYAQEGQSLFVIEAGSRCPSGAGMYKFSSTQTAQLYSIVSQNMTGLVRSPHHSTSSLILSPATPTSTSSSPTTSPTFCRSSSLHGNVFEVKNIGDDQTLVKEGQLEITAHDIVYTDAVSHQRYQWPLMYLRRYGCEGNVFSIEAGRRCQGGEATYAFMTPQASEIRDIIRSIHQSDLDSPRQPPMNSPPLLALSSPATPVLSHNSSTSNTRSKDGSSPPPHEFHRSDSLLRRSHSAMELSRNIFDVHNISDERKEVGQGKLEVTRTDLIYVDSNTHEKWKWPLRFLRRYGCNGNIFSFEAGRRCPGGEGLYAFSTIRASEIHEAIILSINNRQSPEDSLGSMLDLSMQRMSPPLSARSYSYSPWRHSQQMRPLPAVPNQLQSRAHSVSPSTSPLPPPAQTPPSKPPRARRRGAAGNNKPQVQHTYDIPSEVKNEYTSSQQLEEDGDNLHVGKEQVKENKSPKNSKKDIPPSKSSKPSPPKKSKAALAWLKNKHTNSSTEVQSPTNKKARNRKEKSKSPCSPTSSQTTQDNFTSSSEEVKIYENTKQLVNESLGNTPDSPKFESLVPQPTESSFPQGASRESITSSLYQNLECFSPSQPEKVTTEIMYANLEVSESAPPQVNSEDSFVPGSYIEVEFIDGESSLSNHVTQETAPLKPTTPSSTTSKKEDDTVTYATPDFERTAILSKLQRQQRDVANHETLLKRHELREGKTSRRKK